METLTTEQLERAMRDNERFTLINVLDMDEFNKNHIPGSINIPLSQEGFLDAVEHEVNDKDAHIIVYCANEDCPASTKAAEKLDQAGYTNVYDYEGGMVAWQEADNLVASS